MRFILILSDYEYLKGKMYPFDLLSQYFKEKGHQLDWFNIDQYKKIPKTTLNTYDVLLFNNAKLREPHLISPFLKKPMITFKTGTNLEMFTMHPNFKYGIPTPYFLSNGHNEGKLFLSRGKTFNCPVYCAYQLPKPNALSRQEFYNKYSIPDGNKLAIFLPGLLDKLCKLVKTMKKTRIPDKYKKLFDKIAWVLSNVDTIQSYLIKLGYTLLVKNHCRTERRYQNKESKLYKDMLNCTMIDLEDGYEAYRYSDFAITIGSSIVYELYLYDLPTLELGFGEYLFRWSKFMSTPKALQYYKQYNRGEDLIFGKVCNDSDFTNLEETIIEFSRNLPKIENFAFKDKHPLLGETYHQSVEKMYELIMSQL